MRRVLITRAAEDAESLAAPLREAGFEPVLVPLIERRWHPLPEQARLADWLLLTSPATVLGLPSTPLAHRVMAVGPATARAAEQHGIRVDQVASPHTGEAAVAAMALTAGASVLYPHAEHATPSTRAALHGTGAEVRSHVVYRNVCPSDAEARLRAALPVDVVTLLSASAAERLAELAPNLLGAAIVCIGPSTTAAATSAGLQVVAEAAPHTVNGVVAAVLGLGADEAGSFGR